MSLKNIDPGIVRAVDCRNVLGEGPVWSPLEKTLYWVDVEKPTLWRLDPASGETTHWDLPKPPAVIGLRKNGGLLLLFRRGRLLLDKLEAGDVIPDPAGLPLEQDRLNDGRVDPAGRMWVGSLARDLKSPVGRLYRIGEDATLDAMDTGFTLSNGMGWSPQRSTMYFADTYSKTIHAYDFDERTGAVANRRPFAVIVGGGGPDGLAVDGAGNVWVAVFGAGAVHCYRPDGGLARVITLPTAYPTSCTFGGENLGTLYVTSASMTLHGHDVPEDDAGGALWAIHGLGRGQSEYLIQY